LQVLGAVTEHWAQPIDQAVRTVELKAAQRKGMTDNLDEIRPATADSGLERRNDISHDEGCQIAESLSSALEIQEEEDAAMARRLAEENEWVRFLPRMPVI